MPNSRPRTRSTDYGPRGAGQLDERVRVQRVKTATSDLQTNPEYEDIVPGGTAQNIADSERSASVIPLEGESDQEFAPMMGDVTRARYRVKLRHIPEVTTQYRFVWRRVFLYVQAVDHQTERRAGGGYSNFVCVHSSDQAVETLPGGTTAGGGTPNTSGEIGVDPLT